LKKKARLRNNFFLISSFQNGNQKGKIKMADMCKIKAIETEYNGYLFRSRIEARWAVFFDTLGVKYEYEKEGYDLGHLGWYLPDFWLPELKVFVEVKGKYPTLKEELKARQLIWDTDYSMIFLFGNIPSPDMGYYNDNWVEYLRVFGKYNTTEEQRDGLEIVGHEYSPKTPTLGEHWGYGDTFLVCTGCGRLSIEHGSHDTDEGDFCCFKSRTVMPTEAFKAARQARFEHGETPHTKQIVKPSWAR
jgi:hypothetical protein